MGLCTSNPADFITMCPKGEFEAPGGQFDDPYDRLTNRHRSAEHGKARSLKRSDEDEEIARDGTGLPLMQGYSYSRPRAIPSGTSTSRWFLSTSQSRDPPPLTNNAWWKFQVYCTLVEEVSRKQDDSLTAKYLGLRDRGDGTSGESVRWIKMCLLSLEDAPVVYMEEHLDDPIEAFTEMREAYFANQPSSWTTYHSWIIMECGGGKLNFALEKKTHKLEMMIGLGSVSRTIIKDFRATGLVRNIQRITERHTTVSSGITVRQVLEWIDGHLAEHWTPYNFLHSNCQHFSQSLQEFLLRPEKVEAKVPPLDRAGAVRALRADSRSLLLAPPSLRADRNVVIEALNPNWMLLRYLSDQFREDQELVLTAVKMNGFAMQWAAKVLREDREFVLKAVAASGTALYYCAPDLRQDKEVVLTAIWQNALALQFAAKHLRLDRDFLLAAAKANGHVLMYIDEPSLWLDKEIVLASVKQNGLAFQHVADRFKDDMHVMCTACQSNPRALQYALR